MLIRTGGEGGGARGKARRLCGEKEKEKNKKGQGKRWEVRKTDLLGEKNEGNKTAKEPDSFSPETGRNALCLR